MGFTKKSLMDYARYRVAGGADIRKLGIEEYQIIQWEKDAIERMVRRDLGLDKDIKNLDLAIKNKIQARAQMYLGPFNAIAVNEGVIDLTNQAEVDGMLVESIPLFGSVTHEDLRFPMVYCASLDEMLLNKTKIYGYYSIKGNFILTKNTDGLLDSLVGLATIWAAKVPTIATVPRARRERLVNIMTELFAEAINLPIAEQEAEKL